MNSSDAAVMGAALYAATSETKETNLIASRISRRHFGVSVSTEFQEGIDDGVKSYIEPVTGRRMCTKMHWFLARVSIPIPSRHSPIQLLIPTNRATKFPQQTCTYSRSPRLRNPRGNWKSLLAHLIRRPCIAMTRLLCLLPWSSLTCQRSCRKRVRLSGHEWASLWLW